MQPAASSPSGTHFDPVLIAEMANQIPPEVEMHKYDIVLRFPSPETEVDVEAYPFFLDKVLKFKYESKPDLDNFYNYLEFLISSMRYEEAIRLGTTFKGENTKRAQEYLAFCYLMTWQLSKYDSIVDALALSGYNVSVDLVARGEKIYGKIHNLRICGEKRSEFYECLLEILSERYAYLSTKYSNREINTESSLFWLIWMAHFKAGDKEAADNILDTLVQTVDIPDELYREIIETLLEVEEVSQEMMIMAEDLYEKDPVNPLVLRLNAVWNHRLGNTVLRDLFIERLKHFAETYPEEQLQIEACLVYKNVGDLHRFKILARKIVPAGTDLNCLSPKSMFVCDYLRDISDVTLEPIDPKKNISPLYQIAFIEQALIRKDEITDKLKEMMKDLLKKYPRSNKIREVAILFHLKTKKYENALEDIRSLIAHRGPNEDIFAYLDKLVGLVDANEIAKCVAEIDNLFGHIPYIAVETLDLLLKLKKYDRFLSQLIKRKKVLGPASQARFKSELISRMDQFSNLEAVPLTPFFLEVIIWRAKKTKNLRDIEYLSKLAPEDADVKKMVGVLNLNSDLANAPFETLLAAAPHMTDAQEFLRCMQSRSRGEWVIIYRSMNKKFREEPEILQKAFDAHFQEAKYSEAFEIGKNLTGFALEKAKCQFHLGKKSLALALVNAFLKTNPKQSDALALKKEIEGQINPSPSAVIVSSEKKDRRLKTEKHSNWEVGFNFSNEKPDFDPYYNPHSVSHIKARLAKMQKEEARSVAAPQAATPPAEVKQNPAPKTPIVSEIAKLSVGSVAPSPTPATIGDVKILSRPIALMQSTARITPPMQNERISPTPIIAPFQLSEENQRSITQMMNLLVQTYDFIELIRRNPQLYSNEFVVYNLVYAFVKILKPLHQLLIVFDRQPELAKHIQTKLNDLDKSSCVTSEKLIKFFEYTKSFNLIQKLKTLDEDPTSLKGFGIQFFSIVDRQKEASLDTKNAYERGKEGLNLMSELIKAINYHFHDYQKDDVVSKKTEHAAAMKGALILFLKTMENLPLNILGKKEVLEKFSFYKVLASRIFTNFTCDISTIMRITTVSFSEISDLEFDYLKDISINDFLWVRNNTERLLK